MPFNMSLEGWKVGHKDGQELWPKKLIKVNIPSDGMWV